MRIMDIPKNDTAGAGVYVFVWPDNKIKGFVEPQVVVGCVSKMVSYDINPEMFLDATAVCDFGLKLLHQGATHELALDISLATLGLTGNPMVKKVAKVLFRGDTFNYYHMDDCLANYGQA
jgi:hypothetical protein